MFCANLLWTQCFGFWTTLSSFNCHNVARIWIIWTKSLGCHWRAQITVCPHDKDIAPQHQESVDQRKLNGWLLASLLSFLSSYGVVVVLIGLHWKVVFLKLIDHNEILLCFRKPFDRILKELVPLLSSEVIMYWWTSGRDTKNKSTPISCSGSFIPFHLIFSSCLFEKRCWFGLQCKQCSSLKCAHAFQCEGLPNNHTALKLSNFLATLHKKKLDIGGFVLNMKIIWCLTILKKYTQ